MRRGSRRERYPRRDVSDVRFELKQAGKGRRRLSLVIDVGGEPIAVRHSGPDPFPLCFLIKAAIRAARR
jgi:hypothetical protein